MEGINNPDLLKQLMQGKASNAKPAKWALLRDGEIVPLNKGTTVLVGSYQGKVGSVRRSRKGRTYRAPNGSRNYINGTPDIIAYKV